MKKLIPILGCLLLACAVSAQSGFYDFNVKTIDGKNFKLSKLKGKKVMVVNVASQCALTPQYEQLQALYDKYRKSGFVIIAFPANDFRAQEPGTNEEIWDFCTSNYGVTFPMMAKVSVTGDNIAPVYAWLTQKSLNGVSDEKISWNFQKFLIDRNGNLAKVIPPKTAPLSAEIVEWIEAP